ncbi:hypothetical protein AKJ37_05855 [candidate division MSBL1 archaeon SCGC-AAA259I09]|uniref:NADH oxidase n=2 Tax=candidate division MSBL1 TaxID=215777 RepID=A0A133UQS9_9EURY|nr:hypothetical protein AKJ37_05855 [candidate division MSBL1 archaeon SCGC-AAA259I09]KXA96487.1 hypothetical protein AKJ38_03210 [candidate division MSBL1 archaeon SCGC-AAA259I14]
MSKEYPGEEEFPYLFKPIKIGDVEIPNRMKYAATEDNYNARDGSVTDRGFHYIRERAESGAGLVTVQGVFMDPNHWDRGYDGQAALYDEKFVSGIKRWADVIEENGAVSNLQLMNCGRVAVSDTETSPGPSDVPTFLHVLNPPQELSKEDIHETIQQHKKAAELGVEAGFDIIEISGIVGYLISNFISSYTNRRTDEYGGDIEGRCRFMVETIEEVKDAIGDTPTIIRLCAEELMEEYGGNTPEESIQSIKMAEDAGIDGLSVTVGWQESRHSVITRDVPQGYWLDVAERVKNEVDIPVSMAYRLFKPHKPHQAIKDGNLDIWEMCRPMIADPYLPQKIREGRLEDIRSCIACNFCLQCLFRDVPVKCKVNPRCGQEGNSDYPKIGPEGSEEYHAKETDEKKDILVIGGGPGGLEFGRAAARRGHNVDIYEKNDFVGGQLHASAQSGREEEEVWGFAEWQKNQCDKYGANIHTGTEVDAEFVKEKNPEAVVIATGAKAAVPEVPGVDKNNVVTCIDILEGKAKAGENVVVWGGRGAGIITGLYLARQGKNVDIVTNDRRVGVDVNVSYIWRYRLMLQQEGANTHGYSELVEITEDSAIIRDEYGVKKELDTDSIVSANLVSNNDLVDPIKKVCDDVHVIGDAQAVSRLQKAVVDGYKLGVSI